MMHFSCNVAVVKSFNILITFGKKARDIKMILLEHCVPVNSRTVHDAGGCCDRFQVHIQKQLRAMPAVSCASLTVQNS